MTTSEAALRRLAEKGAAPSHPLAGVVARGGKTIQYRPGIAAASGVATAPAQVRGPGIVGATLMIVAALVGLLWVLGFGLGFIAYLVMGG